MKKLLFTLMMLVGITATAQTEHLTFKGVPIDGTLTSFVSKMKQKGLSHLATRDGTAVLEGDFAGYKGCTIAASEYETGMVNRVVVIFPEKDTWTGLYGDYITIKKLLTQKYGEPTDVIEEFQGYSNPSDDNERMFRVKYDQCKYICDFINEKGAIELKILHDDSFNCYISLLYIDAANESKVQSSAIEDL